MSNLGKPKIKEDLENKILTILAEESVEKKPGELWFDVGNKSQMLADKILNLLQPKESKATNQEPNKERINKTGLEIGGFITKDWEKELKIRLWEIVEKWTEEHGFETSRDIENDLLLRILPAIKSLLKTQREESDEIAKRACKLSNQMGQLQAKKEFKRKIEEKIGIHKDWIETDEKEYATGALEALQDILKEI